VKPWLGEADVSRGRDWFSRSEFYLGVVGRVAPRYRSILPPGSTSARGSVAPDQVLSTAIRQREA